MYTSPFQREVDDLLPLGPCRTTGRSRVCKLEIQLLGRVLQSMHSVPSQEKTGRRAFLLAFSLLVSVIATVVFHSPIELVGISPFGFRAKCFGVCLLGGNLESWNPWCVAQTLYSSGRSWELGVLSWLYGIVPGVGFMVSVSQPFLQFHC